MTLRWDNRNTLRTDRRIQPQPFHPLTRDLEVVDYEPADPAPPEPATGETALMIGMSIAAIVIMTLAAVGAVVLSRWAWTHPGQFAVWFGITCFAGWGLWEVVSS